MGSEARVPVEAVIKVNTVDVTDVVRYGDAVFISQVNGSPGGCMFAVRDAEHTRSFKFGDDIELSIGGEPKWVGSVVRSRRQFSAAVVDTTDTAGVTRWWVIEGYDINWLLSKRVVRRKGAETIGALPAPVEFRDPNRSDMWAEATATDDMLPYILEEYTDLSADGISFAGIENIGTVNPDGPVQMGGGLSVFDFMTGFNNFQNALFYITPDKTFVYRDVEEATTPYWLTDQPDPEDEFSIGPRDLVVETDAGQMANDALVWGTAAGYPAVRFGRAEDTAKQDIHGLWQIAEFNTSMYKQASINQRASALINGNSPTRHGAKEPRVSVTATVFAPLFNLGDVAFIRSKVWNTAQYGPFDVDDDGDTADLEISLPVRRVTISFPTPRYAKFDLLLTQELDTPWSVYEWIPYKPLKPDGSDGGGGGPLPPWPPTVTEGGGGCTDAICGITDSFGRSLGAGWGVADAGMEWSTSGASSDVGGGYGHLGVTTNSSGQIDLTGPVSDTLVRARLDNATGANAFFIGVDVAGDAGYVEVDFESDGSLSMVDSDPSDTVSTTMGFGAGTEFYIRIVIIDDHTAHAYCWEATDAEPGSPTLVLTTTDSIGPDVLDLFVGGSAGGSGSFDVYVASIDIFGVNRCGAVQFEDFNSTVDSDFGGGWSVTPSGSPDDYGTNGSEAFVIDGGLEATIDGSLWATDPVTFVVRYRSTLVSGAALNLSILDGLGDRVTTELLIDNTGGGIVVNNTIDANSDADLITTFTTDWWYLKWQLDGSTHRAKAWSAGDAEPDWMVSAAMPTLVDRPSFRMNMSSGTGGTLRVDSIDFDYPGRPCYVDCGAYDSFIVDSFDRTESLQWGEGEDTLEWELVYGSALQLTVAPGLAVMRDQTTGEIRLMSQLGYRIDSETDIFDIKVLCEFDFSSALKTTGVGTNIFAFRMGLTNDVGAGAHVVLGHYPANMAGAPQPVYISDSFEYTYLSETSLDGMYWVRMRHDPASDSIDAKVWAEGDDEPDWMVSSVGVVSTSFLQYLYLGYTADVENFGIGTTYTGYVVHSIWRNVDTCEDVPPADGGGVPTSGPYCEVIEHSGGTNFVTATSFESGSQVVQVNGLVQMPGSDYTANGVEGLITMDVALDSNDTFRVCYQASEPT